MLAPALASNTAGSAQMICQNNLRLIGRALHSWAGDHQNKTPWWTPLVDGGTQYSGKPGSAWYEYFILTNELSRPSVFACAADTAVRPSQTWMDFYIHRQNSVSYSIWIHATMDNPRGIVSTDHYTRYDPGFGSCSAGYSVAQTVRQSGSSILAWTNGYHGTAGNVLITDGSVEFTSTSRLRELATNSPSANDGDATHVIKAR